MSFLQAINPLYVLSGFGVGFLVGITGVGGGSLMTPILVLVFGVPPVAAVGTDLLYASITKTGGTLVHGFNNTVDWRVVFRLACGSLPAAVLTLAALYFFRVDTAASNVLISKVLGTALLLTSVALVMRKRLLATYSRRVGVLSPAKPVISPL
jgi:uncharacterized membrane protein YfcA